MRRRCMLSPMSLPPKCEQNPRPILSDLARAACYHPRQEGIGFQGNTLTALGLFQRPEPAQTVGTAAGLVDATNIPSATVDGVVRAVLIDPRAEAGRAHGERHQSVTSRLSRLSASRPVHRIVSSSAPRAECCATARRARVAPCRARPSLVQIRFARWWWTSAAQPSARPILCRVTAGAACRRAGASSQGRP
jgi:hypothetical protein